MSGRRDTDMQEMMHPWLAGADQVFHAATSAIISGTDVILSSTSVPDPVAVRYAWSPAPVNVVNLVNGAGLPAAPFRTDDALDSPDATVTLRMSPSGCDLWKAGIAWLPEDEPIQRPRAPSGS